MQFFIFMICMFCGIISGVVYDILYIVRCILCGADKSAYTVKDKIFIVAADFIYCLVFAAMFVFTSVMFDFEGLRLYMLIGCVLGALIYLKSFHLIVAFLCKKVYNKIEKQKEKRCGRTKALTSGGGDNGQCNITRGDSYRSDNLSAGVDSGGKQAKKRNRKRNPAVRKAFGRRRKESGIS